MTGRRPLSSTSHCGAALHLEQEPGDHESRDADRRARVGGLGEQLLPGVHVALAVLRHVDDEARHLQQIRQLEPPARRTRSMLSNVCLVCDSMSSANTCPLVSRAEMPESQRTSPDRTQLVNPKGSYCKTPSTGTTCLVTMTSRGCAG